MDPLSIVSLWGAYNPDYHVSGSALMNLTKQKMCFKNKMMTKVNKEVENLNSPHVLYQPWDSKFHN